MPTYTFLCEDCGVSKDVKRGCMQHSKVHCPYCKAPMQRIYEPAPTIFRQGGTGARRNG